MKLVLATLATLATFADFAAETFCNPMPVPDTPVGILCRDSLNGDAIHIDFGTNAMGANTEYRGSFIRYIRSVSDGQPALVKNLGLNENYFGKNQEELSFTDLNGGDLNDAMVDNLNISGKLFASSGEDGRAIYIAEDAFVKNINLNEGAEIHGDIGSAWKKFDSEIYGMYSQKTKLEYNEIVSDKNGNPIYDKNGEKKTKRKKSFAEPLMIQYKDKNYLYTDYIPELVTNLNFNADNNFSNKIEGDDNLKINVNGGNLNFTGGTANVVSVKVSEGAKVTDGNFTVNNMDEKIAKDFSDEETGKFFNHGTIFAKDDDFKIDGDLISDGILQITNGKIFEVSGTADLNNSTIEILNAEKNIPIKILTAEKIIYDKIKTPENSKIEIVGNDLILTFSN